MIKKRLKIKKVNNTSNIEKISFHTFALYDISFKTVYNVISWFARTKNLLLFSIYLFYIHTFKQKHCNKSP